MQCCRCLACRRGQRPGELDQVLGDDGVALRPDRLWHRRQHVVKRAHRHCRLFRHARAPVRLVQPQQCVQPAQRIQTPLRRRARHCAGLGTAREIAVPSRRISQPRCRAFRRVPRDGAEVPAESSRGPRAQEGARLVEVFGGRGLVVDDGLHEEQLLAREQHGRHERLQRLQLLLLNVPAQTAL
ncbi:hypothetical protein CLOM_g1034 [Closterium sp. NIES-68]|nr:hypothetical protein CLOM_g1034 [Closterium sp. NIES-68]GJP71654.1 hypothetical protein CLOP_g2467 [Closterium sp. NIES-67]